MKIGFTGTRLGVTKDQFLAFTDVIKKEAPERVEFHHGMCVGADSQIARLIRLQYRIDDCVIVGHPPINLKYYKHIRCDRVTEPKDYLKRNKDIVDETDLLIACPASPEALRSGTWSTVWYARKKKKPIIIIMPDGTITRE